MERKLIICKLWLIALFTFACQKNLEQTETGANKLKLNPEVVPDSLSSSFMEWWTYQTYEISLSADFKAYDTAGQALDKKSFLNQLTSGDYIPLRLQASDGLKHYQLFKLDSLADKSIRNTIRNQAYTSLKHYTLEETPFPDFDFKDLVGNHFTNENTKGKTLVFKTWFIKCQACVAEFPELNELVEKYSLKDDILFISLALNAQNDLEQFLQKKVFDYAVIPKQAQLIGAQLQLDIYPSHLVVDKTGKIRKVTNKASDMISYLEHSDLLN